MAVLLLASCGSGSGDGPEAIEELPQTSLSVDGVQSSSASAPEELSSSDSDGSVLGSVAVSEGQAIQVSSEEGMAGFDVSHIPVFDGDPSCVVNDDEPFFSDDDLERGLFEEYSPLDSLGRCGVAFAKIDKHMMPTEERESIGEIRPSGWHTVRYPWVDQEYLYNRCHLIGYQLTGQNINEQNLITGTRFMNVEGMEPYESEVAEYIRATGNSVLYRSTPVFEGDNLLASGVLLEAQSVEDGGAGLRFCRWCYNVEPGVGIDYATGDNWADGTRTAEDAPAAQAAVAAGTAAAETESSVSEQAAEVAAATETADAAENADYTYMLNTNSHKFHRPGCSSIDDMAEWNKEPFCGTREEAIGMGYDPCGICKP